MLLNNKYKINILLTTLAVLISLAAIISGLFILASGILMMIYGFGAVYGIFAGFSALFSASQFTAGLEIAAIGLCANLIGGIIGISTIVHVGNKIINYTGLHKKIDDMQTENDSQEQTSDVFMNNSFNSTNCRKKENNVFSFFYRNSNNKRNACNDNTLDLTANDEFFVNVNAPGSEPARSKSLEEFLVENDTPAMEI